MSDDVRNQLMTSVSADNEENTTMQSKSHRRLVRLGCALALCWLGLGVTGAHSAETQRHFKEPGQAMAAVLEAIQTGNAAEFDVIFGPGSEDLRSSGDAVADKAALEKFAAAAKEHTGLEHDSPERVLFSIGADDWPFPIPLVKSEKGWSFDTAAGREELINRRIGRNELHAIATVQAIVDAQEEYRSKDRIGSGRQYAQQFRSSEGNQDGLYWPSKEGEEESPLGPLAAEASKEGYFKGEAAGPQPYHGYFFRILKAQGKNAPGGAKSYVKDGKMTGGFAVLAWPADYGNSGIKTFVVSQNDIVFEKDLGDETAKAAEAITEYDPDDSWDTVEEPSA
jgi:hypothetical protein